MGLLMDSMQFALSREVGSLPVSIGTSLAFENVFERNALEQYDVVLINLRTMVRNFYSAFKSGVGEQVDPADAALIVIDELQTLVSQFKKAMPVVYVSNYSDLESFLPGCVPMVHRGEKRIIMNALEEDAVAAILKQGTLRVECFETCKLEFKVKGRALLFSHVVTDLFIRYDFTTLDLLESYTASIKERHEWYTKLTNGKELTCMPFNKFTLAVFGDKSVYISPQGLSVRRRLLALAEAENWTTITSMEKIRSDLKKVESGEIKDILISLSSRYL